MYVISVGGLTVLFSIFYASSRKEADAREQASLNKAKAQADALAAKKKEDEAKARADAEERDAKRKAEEKAKEEEARRKWDEDSKRIQDDTNTYLARAAKAQQEVSRMEIELDTLRKKREKTNREAFDSAKLVEKAEVEKENAEFRTQYLLEQINTRLANSPMARLPAPPVAATGK